MQRVPEDLKTEGKVKGSKNNSMRSFIVVKKDNEDVVISDHPVLLNRVENLSGL
jgi:hypothetical protein